MSQRRTRRRYGQSASASIARNSFATPCAGTSNDWRAKRTPGSGSSSRSTRRSWLLPRSRTGGRPRIGRIGLMQRGEVWFAAAPGGDRPVMVLTRDPVADRIDAVVVAALTRTRRGLISELELTARADNVPTDCIVNFDNLHTLRKTAFRRQIASLSPTRMARACRTLAAATGC